MPHRLAGERSLGFTGSKVGFMWLRTRPATRFKASVSGGPGTVDLAYLSSAVPLVLLVATKDRTCRHQDTASGPSGRWQVEVGSCRVAGRDGTLAKVGVGAPRRRRPRAPAPPKPPKRCPYQRPGPSPRPPLARRAGRGRGGDHRAVGPRTGAAAGALRRGRRDAETLDFSSL